MTGSELDALTAATKARYRDAAGLVEASLGRYRAFDPARTYTEERERDRAERR